MSFQVRGRGYVDRQTSRFLTQIPHYELCFFLSLAIFTSDKDIVLHSLFKIYKKNIYLTKYVPLQQFLKLMDIKKYITVTECCKNLNLIFHHEAFKPREVEIVYEVRSIDNQLISKER